MFRKIVRYLILYQIFIFYSLSWVIAQEPDSLLYELKNYQDSIDFQIQHLKIAIQKLNEMILEQKKEDELKALLEDASRLSMEQEEEKIDVSKKYFSGERQQQGLNPNISFGVDFFGSFSSSDESSINESGDINYGNNGFFLREAQVSLIAPLDPFTRGKGFLSATPSGFTVDEAYLEWLNLPLHLNLKAGYFKTEFGFYNRYHDHALPQFDRPKALVNLFGTAGLGGPGIATNFMLPPIIAHASTLDFSFLVGSNPQSFPSDPPTNVIFSGQFLNYYDITASSYLEIRLSGAAGRNDNPAGMHNSYVGSGGIAYKWAPIGREKYRTVEWKTEFLFSQQEYNAGKHQSMGFYSSIQNKLGARFWLSGRVGYSELPYDPSQYEWDYTLVLDFWQSEFVFTRFQYQYNDRTISARKDVIGPFPKEHTFLIQVVWAMGPHKHEAY